MSGHDWPRYAKALDMRLEGATLEAISQELGVSRERVRQILPIAARRLAYRVFVGVKPFEWEWDKYNERWKRYG